MKMLSTPTARTKNGMISKIIRVAETPMNPNIPIEAATDNNTIITPPRPRVILLSIANLLSFEIFPKLKLKQSVLLGGVLHGVEKVFC